MVDTTRYDDLVSQVAVVAATMTARVPVLVAGIARVVRAEYAGRADENIRPMAMKELDCILDEVVSKSDDLVAAMNATE